MRVVAEPIPHLRLQRYHRWAMLWLTWFAAFLEAAADFAPLSKAAHALAHRWLDYVEALIVRIVMLRAAPRLRVLKRRAFAAVAPRAGFFRAYAGSRMRRALRSRDLRARMAALRQNIDGLVALLLRRLPCGLTRRRPILPRPEACFTCADEAPRAHALCADTS
ncbi:MAG: hypothetical protein QM759_10595 [Terricaulis sp.]